MKIKTPIGSAPVIEAWHRVNGTVSAFTIAEMTVDPDVRNLQISSVKVGNVGGYTVYYRSVTYEYLYKNRYVEISTLEEALEYAREHNLALWWQREEPEFIDCE